jgi:hypothetical protein
VPLSPSPLLCCARLKQALEVSEVIRKRERLESDLAGVRSAQEALARAQIFNLRA